MIHGWRLALALAAALVSLRAGAQEVLFDEPTAAEESPASQPASQPASEPASRPAPSDEDPAVHTGLDEGEPGLAEFARNFSAHEPMYFAAGPKDPNLKFQVSFKYALFNPDASLARAFRAFEGINIGYTQTSFWDTDSPSNPFFDSSYKPEALWSDEYIPALSAPGRFRLGLQAGVQHESNGRDGADSRSLNIVYVRPIVTFGDPETFHVTLSPKVYGYIGNLGDNPDIADYRGYADLRATAGWRRGVQLAATGRVGNDWDKGSIQLDLTYPLRRIPVLNNIDAYFLVQGFYGYGESLLEYDEEGSSLRFGVAFVR